MCYLHNPTIYFLAVAGVEKHAYRHMRGTSAVLACLAVLQRVSGGQHGAEDEIESPWRFEDRQNIAVFQVYALETGDTRVVDDQILPVVGSRRQFVVHARAEWFGAHQNNPLHGNRSTDDRTWTVLRQILAPLFQELGEPPGRLLVETNGADVAGFLPHARAHIVEYAMSCSLRQPES